MKRLAWRTWSLVKRPRWPAGRSLGRRIAVLTMASTALSLLLFAGIAYALIIADERSEAVSGIALSPEDEAQSQVLLAMLVASPVGLLAAVVGALWITRRELAPVDDIIRAATEMTTRDLHKRLPLPHAVTELRTLALALNGLLERLEHGFQSLDRFAADVSHELRTPLAVVMSQLEVALRRARTSEEWAATASTSLDELRQMTRLVQSLLALARANTAALPVPVPLSVRDVAEHAVSTVRQLAATKDIQLTLSPQAGRNTRDVAADADTLCSAVATVLANAISYTPVAGQVRLSIEYVGHDRIALHVDDSGPGVRDDERERIFEPFARGSAAQAADASPNGGGLGLGLSIARRIIEHHGGTLCVSTTPAAGARFTLELPCLPAGACA